VALTVNMPQLGESVTEGTIARWLKQPGETVARYESIAEVASDKVNAEIPAPADGTLGEIIAAEGTVVSVGQPICTIEQGGAAAGPGGPSSAAATGGTGAEPGSAATPEAAPPAAPAPAPAASPEPVAAERLPAAPAAAASQVGTGTPMSAPGASADGSEELGRHHVTPAVRMLVREHEVDLDEVQGTGIGGRITKRDVLEYVQRRDAAERGTSHPGAGTSSPSAGASAAAVPGGSAAAAPAAGVTPPSARPVAPGAAPGPAGAASPPRGAMPEPAGATSPPRGAGPEPGPAPAAPSAGGAAEEGDRLLPMTSARRAIADHMVRSRQTSPHAWLTVEVDMSRVSRVRESRKADFRERYGVSLTYLPFVARATIEALRRHPTLNAQWSEDGLILKRDIHLGIAIALVENLVVAVLRYSDRLSISGLAQAAADLGARARANRLRLDEIQGGTFTLNNTGALGTVLTHAIINQPQAAILTMDAVIKRPVVVDDMIAIRPIMNLGLSFDHRLNDGLQAARFLVDVKQQLEALDEGAALL